MSFLVFDEKTLNEVGIFELRGIARDMGVPSPTILKKDELIKKIMDITNGNVAPVPRSKRGRPVKDSVVSGTYNLSESFINYNSSMLLENPYAEYIISDIENSNIMAEGDSKEIVGILEIAQEKYGFIRSRDASVKDAYISENNIRALNLRAGDIIKAQAKSINNDRYFVVLNVLSVNNHRISDIKDRPVFESLSQRFPNKKLLLCDGSQNEDLDLRCIDLFSPIGFGQRALISYSGYPDKTTLIKNIANGILANNSSIHLMTIIMEGRPEDINYIASSVGGEVICSAFTLHPLKQVQSVELNIERAKRMVEEGRDVVVILDSLTRFVLSYNASICGGSNVLNSEIDDAALLGAKKLLACAGNFEGAGSLTIIYTMLKSQENGVSNRIYDGLRVVSNSEIVFDEQLITRRISPSLDIKNSKTYRDELLLTKQEIMVASKLRESYLDNDIVTASKLLNEKMNKYKTNDELIKNNK